MNDAVQAELEEEEEEVCSGIKKCKRKSWKQSTQSKAKSKDCDVSDTEDLVYVASESESESDTDCEAHVSLEEVCILLSQT